MPRTFRIGDIIEGVVTGIQKYGVFVKLDEETQGLVHISECESGYISNLNEFVQVGQPIKVIIIDIDEYTKKISLSIRYLTDEFRPSYVAKQRNKAKRHLPDIGFKTIEEKLPEWINEGLEDIHTDKFNIHSNKHSKE